MPRSRGPGGRFVRSNPTRFSRYHGLRAGLGAAVGPVLQQAVRFAKSISRTRTKTRTVSGQSKPRWNDSATYDGRFLKRRGAVRKRYVKRRTYRKSPAVKGENYYSKHGATSTLETIGAASDPDVVYIGHTAHSSYEALLLTGCSILRNLYKEAVGYETRDLNEKLPVPTSHIVIKLVNTQTNVVITNDVYTNADSTLWTLAGSDHIFGELARFSEGGAGYNDLRFEDICLYEWDSPAHRLMARLDLSHASVDMYAKSELKIQNRSNSNPADNENTDINAVPLVGRQYTLPGCAPNVKGVGAINTWDQSLGMTIARSQESQMNVALREPPPSAVFRGCTGSSKVRLEPGAVKSDWVIQRLTLPLEKFLRRAAWNADDSVQSIKSTLSGNSLIALEKVIGVFGSPAITLQYECNFWCGIVVKHKSWNAALSRVVTGVRNNLAPT